jgi:hypothetical protein
MEISPPLPLLARRLPRTWPGGASPPPGLLGLLFLSIRGEMGDWGNCGLLYNPLIGISWPPFFASRSSLFCGHHVRHSEVLWLERQVFEPSHQFSRQS